MVVENEDLILLSHGGGGSKTSALINDIILKHFKNPILDKLDDGATLDLPSTNIVMSTDSYVITPLFFPGGNIGSLAACGTINDLTMQGAKPLHLSLGLILEEGFSINRLETILQSLADVINPLNINIVTGDTKVVEHGSGHGLFINTTGIGLRLPKTDVHVSNAKTGDQIILTGSMGDHGMAIMCQREGLQLESTITSDVASLWPMIATLFEANIDIHVLRDPTRGGVAASLNDIAKSSNCGIRLIEKTLPVKPQVASACALLGLDPLTIANEGKAIIVTSAADAKLVLNLLHQHPLGHDALIIGEVVDRHAGQVLLETNLGGERIVDIPTGENLPRIC